MLGHVYNCASLHVSAQELKLCQWLKLYFVFQDPSPIHFVGQSTLHFLRVASYIHVSPTDTPPIGSGLPCLRMGVVPACWCVPCFPLSFLALRSLHRPWTNHPTKLITSSVCSTYASSDSVTGTAVLPYTIYFDESAGCGCSQLGACVGRGVVCCNQCGDDGSISVSAKGGSG